MRKEVRREDYVLAALVAATAAHLGHRWARYIGSAWTGIIQACEKGLIGEDFLATLPDNPFIARDPDEAYDITAILRAYARSEAGYLDLVLGVPPEEMPVLLREEAEEALRAGEALAYLTKHTYHPGAIPGINSPGIVRTQYGCVWRHTTATGRGHFEIESAPGRLDFRLRVERGGDKLGLTALEVFLRQARVAGDATNLQVTPLAKERHREYAMALLEGIAREVEKVPGAPNEALLVGQELANLANSITQE